MVDTIIDTNLLNFCHHITDLSADIAKKYYRMPNGEVEKGDQSPVTLADREIEAIIRENIKQHYPDHGIIGEEYGRENENSEFQWIIDPIDGTSSFIIGRPTFGTLIALAYQNKPILGIINQPINGERWIGIDDGSENSGAWLNNTPIKTRNCTSIENSVISTTSPYFFDEYDWRRFQKITSQAKYQKYGGVIYGGDCYSYALLATGHLDIIIEPNLQVYDYAALLPIVRAAGGQAGDWQGFDLDLKSDIKLLACATPQLYRQVCKTMNY